MAIKNSVLNTFNRVGIDYKFYQSLGDDKLNEVANWLSGETCQTTALVKACILWVYKTSLAMEHGDHSVRIDDFDRVRYFILDADPTAYSACID